MTRKAPAHRPSNRRRAYSACALRQSSGTGYALDAADKRHHHIPVLATALLAGAVEADGNRRPLAIWIWPVALANGALYLLDDFLRALPVWFTQGHPAHLLALGL